MAHLHTTQYKSQVDLAEGLKKGIYYQGPLYMSRNNIHEGYLHSEALAEDILLQGRENLNRHTPLRNAYNKHNAYTSPTTY